MFANPTALSKTSLLGLLPVGGEMTSLINSARPQAPRAVSAARQMMDEQSAWQAHLHRNFAALSTLQAGWDGPRSRPIAQSLIYKADRLIRDALEGMTDAKPPNVVPSPDGSLQIEWHTANFEFEFTLGADTSFFAWLHNRETGAEIEEEDNAAVDLLLRRARQIAADNRNDDYEDNAPDANYGLLAA